MLQGFAKHGEYVDFGESWLVYLTQQGGKKILVDGEQIIFSYSGSKQIFIKPDAVVQEVARGTKTHTHYEHKDTKEKMTFQEYNSIKYGEYYDSEGSDFRYPSLEIEFEHRKQVEELKENYLPVYHETPDVFEPVTLTCVGRATPTGNEFIETALAYSKAKFSDSGFYRVNWSGLTAKILKGFIDEHDLHKEFSNSDHSNVRFAQIKNKYIMNDNIRGTDKEKYGVYANLELAKDAIESHTKSLRNYLYTKVFGDNIVLNKVTLGNVVKELESIKNSLANIEVKQKGAQPKNILLNKISKLVQDYQNLADK